MQIDQSNFNAWKTDPVTKVYLDYLKVRLDILNQQLSNTDVLMSENSDKAIPYIVGGRDVLENVIETRLEDLIDLEEEENHED